MVNKTVNIIKHFFEEYRYPTICSMIIMLVFLNFLNSHDIFYTNKFSKIFIDERMLKLIPITTGLFMFYAIYPYLQSSLGELLFLYRRNIFRQIIILLIFENIIMSIEFLLVYRNILEYDMLAYIKYISLSIFFAGIIFGTSMWIKNYTSSLMIVAIIYIIEFFGYEMFGLVSFFTYHYTDFSYFKGIIILLAIGIAGLYLGKMKSRVYDNYP